jgi:hypothetical protein
MADLENLIVRIQKRMLEGGYQNETAVREAVVLPVLGALGWDVLDPDVIRREFGLSGRRVDYALCPAKRTPAIFIEVKAANQTPGGDRQLFEYAFHAGIPMAVLTDGKEWNFYLPGEQGSYDERRFYKLDIGERDEVECRERFTRYLDFSRVKDGQAIIDARSDYHQATKTRIAAESIPKAWNELSSEPDELLIELIAERTESISGFRPDVEEIERFLIKLASQSLASAAKFGIPSQPARAIIQETAASRARTAAPSGERHIEFEILGVKQSAKNAKEAMIAILRSLASHAPDFWEKLAQHARSRTRNHVAQSREAVYPNRPDLAESALEIAPGWWIGVNIANREKDRIIKAACHCANLKFGRDVRISFPNLVA